MSGRPDPMKSGPAVAERAEVGLARQVSRVKSVTLILDEVFFTDGEFVGSNEFGLWDSITSEAKFRIDLAGAALDGRARGISATEILDEIVGPRVFPSRTDSPPEGPEAIRVITQESIERQIQGQRSLVGDERTLEALASQADKPLPDFRKR